MLAIYIDKRSSLYDVQGPVNYDGTSAPDQQALTCGASILPEDLDVSGAFPTINGKPIDSENQFCKISVSYTDGQPIPTCGNGYKLIREWLIIDLCNGGDKRYVQIIKVGDEINPSITCTPTIYAGTNSPECKATATILSIHRMEWPHQLSFGWVIKPAIGTSV